MVADPISLTPAGGELLCDAGRGHGVRNSSMTTANPALAPRLIIRQDLRVIREIQLAEPRYKIGRSARCEISLEHPSVSRLHAEIVQDGDSWRLADCGSTNGVFVNGQLATEVTLQPGDVVEIRPYSLNFLAGDAGAGDQSIVFAAAGAVTTAARAGMYGGTEIVRQRLEDLYALARVVIAHRDSGSLWLSIQAALERSLAANRCVLLGFDATQSLYRLAPRARPSGAAEALDVSRSVLADVIKSGQGVLVERISHDHKYAHAHSLAGGGVGSVICVPVVIDGAPRAIVYADRHESREAFRAEDLEFVAAAVDLAAAAVGLDDLQDKARELARINGRIEAAREIQEMLLPTPLPQPAWGAVAACNLPADQMSGDIYDVILEPDGRLTTLIADVSGKGVPAAFLTALLQSTMRLSLATMDDLGEVVRRVNATIEQLSPDDSFITMVVTRWAADGATVEIANAGHHAPLWLGRDGQVCRHPERVGLPLGVSSAWAGQIVRVDARDYEAMAIFTDGASEARNADGEEFGVEGLTAAFAQLGELTAEQMVAQLEQALERFATTGDILDDVTMVVLRRTTAGGQSA
jgi:sigma-B regulation protein RsbU (phosphoserine phosphatase)